MPIAWKVHGRHNTMDANPQSPVTLNPPFAALYTITAFSKNGVQSAPAYFTADAWQVKTQISIGGILLPAAVYTPDSKWALVKGNGFLAVIDMTTNTLKKKITGMSWDISAVVITPDGQFAWVPGTNNNLHQIDLADLSIKKEVPLNATPRAMALSPNGNELYLANGNTGTVSVLDMKTLTVTGNISTNGFMQGVSATPDGRLLLALDSSNHVIWIIDAVTYKIIHSVGAVANPVAVAVTPDSALAFIANSGNANIMVINLTTYAVVQTIAMGGPLRSVAITPDGRYAIALNYNGNNICVIDVQTLTIFKIIEHIKMLGNGITVSPNGREALISSYGGWSLPAFVVVLALPYE